MSSYEVPDTVLCIFYAGCHVLSLMRCFWTVSHFLTYSVNVSGIVIVVIMQRDSQISISTSKNGNSSIDHLNFSANLYFSNQKIIPVKRGIHSPYKQLRKEEEADFCSW